MQAKRSAVFLDRDGTLNIEKHYLHKYADWEWVPGAQEALAALKAAGYALVVITNQSGVGRGYYTEAMVHALHEAVNKELHAQGVGIDGFYLCPHSPDAPPEVCSCRKPSPVMLQKAADDLHIDLSRSWMIGDKLVDVQAGHNAGCKSILVRTGYGREAEAHVVPGTLVVDTLLAAAQVIIRNGAL